MKPRTSRAQQDEPLGTTDHFLTADLWRGSQGVALSKSIVLSAVASVSGEAITAPSHPHQQSSAHLDTYGGGQACST